MNESEHKPTERSRAKDVFKKLVSWAKELLRNNRRDARELFLLLSATETKAQVPVETYQADQEIDLNEVVEKNERKPVFLRLEVIVESKIRLSEPESDQLDSFIESSEKSPNTSYVWLLLMKPGNELLVYSPQNIASDYGHYYFKIPQGVLNSDFTVSPEHLASHRFKVADAFNQLEVSHQFREIAHTLHSESLGGESISITTTKMELLTLGGVTRRSPRSETLTQPVMNRPVAQPVPV